MPEQSRVLVVDAERRIVRLAQVNLKRAGYQVTAAYDGKAALDKAESQKPDLIVLGTIPPPVDSAELLKRLRDTEATKDIRVVKLADKPEDLTLPHDGD